MVLIAPLNKASDRYAMVVNEEVQLLNFFER